MFYLKTIYVPTRKSTAESVVGEEIFIIHYTYIFMCIYILYIYNF